jgi:hypothetical protein
MAWILIVALLLILVLAAVFSPWRWPEIGAVRHTDDGVQHTATLVGDLAAARDAKYREIRDTEMDRETGKLSIEDFVAVDAGLRAEAVEILQQLDRAQTRLETLQRAAEAEQTDGIQPDAE